jgi:hypothetical protein
VVLGLRGWLTPETCPVGLVPVSLVAVVVALVPLIVKRKLIFEKSRREEETP